jgi:hypothetical protein
MLQTFLIFQIKPATDGVMTMAEVQEVGSPLNFVYKVMFQNGYENEFNTFEDAEDDPRDESKLGDGMNPD